MHALRGLGGKQHWIAVESFNKKQGSGLRTSILQKHFIMFNNLNNLFNGSPKAYVFAFLVFCVLSSKNILIYNEETLITLSFCLFFFFVIHYFGNTVKESLDERSQGIKAECQNFSIYKQQSLQELAAEHKKIGELESALSQLQLFTKENCAQLTQTGAQALKTQFSQQIIQKCGELRAGQLQQKLKSLMARNQLDLVLIYCAQQDQAGTGNLGKGALKRALQLVKSTIKNSK